MARRGTARHGKARHGTARRGTARHGTARHGTARRGTAQHGMARSALTLAPLVMMLQTAPRRQGEGTPDPDNAYSPSSPVHPTAANRNNTHTHTHTHTHTQTHTHTHLFNHDSGACSDADDCLSVRRAWAGLVTEETPPFQEVRLWRMR